MFKLVAVWSTPKPEDVDAFEAAYRTSHGPKARAIPHMAAIDLIRTDRGLEGHDPAFFRVAVMSFADEQAYHLAEQAPEWQALRADAGAMIERFGVSLTVALGTDGPS